MGEEGAGDWAHLTDGSLGLGRVRSVSVSYRVSQPVGVRLPLHGSVMSPIWVFCFEMF